MNVDDTRPWVFKMEVPNTRTENVGDTIYGAANKPGTIVKKEVSPDNPTVWTVYVADANKDDFGEGDNVNVSNDSDFATTYSVKSTKNDQRAFVPSSSNMQLNEANKCVV